MWSTRSTASAGWRCWPAPDREAAISVHPIDSAGILVLPPLLECEDEIIREGVRALLAERAVKGKALARQREGLGWTSFQLADRVLREHLLTVRHDWDEYTDSAKRDAALARFHEYAYQW